MLTKNCLKFAMISLMHSWLLFQVVTAQAGWQETGVRMGVQAGPRREYFHLYEAFAVYGLPWEWRCPSGWGLAPFLNVSAGALTGGNESGFIGGTGAGLVFNNDNGGIALEIGVGLDLMDRRQFGEQDFGSILLWGAHMGVSYRFKGGMGIGYRLQHLSNNRILYTRCTPNPGVDMHMFSVSWYF